MLSFTVGLKVTVALEVRDMRKGFKGLAARVEGRLGEEVRGGTIYFWKSAAHAHQGSFL